MLIIEEVLYVGLFKKTNNIEKLKTQYLQELEENAKIQGETYCKLLNMISHENDYDFNNFRLISSYFEESSTSIVCNYKADQEIWPEEIKIIKEIIKIRLNSLEKTPELQLIDSTTLRLITRLK